LSKLRSSPGRASRPLPPKPVNNNLTIAELSLQRGDFEQSRTILEKRVLQGADDFKTLNMYGVSLAHSRYYEKAVGIFQRLLTSSRMKTQRTKAGFNLGQAWLYHDLDLTGDLSVSNSMFTVPKMVTGYVPVPVKPFQKSLAVWVKLLSGRARYTDIIHTFSGFVRFQMGEYDRALDHLAAALNLNEGFHLSHYVLGRIFLDLYLLALEGNDFSLGKRTAAFYEIEDYEISREENGRVVVQRETFLDIAVQSLMESRNLSPMCPATYLALCDSYMVAGMIEAAQEALAYAETVAPNTLTVLETSLRFNEYIQAKPDVIKSLVERIKVAQQRELRLAYHIMPSYYLF
jgi:tetratricopeptide (TPR) repeat protein